MTLSSLRTRLSQDSTLNAFWQTHYNKDAKHFIGYKRSPSANDIPAVSYVCARKSLVGDLQDDYLVSLVVQVNEPDITDGVFDGVTRLDEVTDLIVGLLNPFDDPSGNTSWVEGAITVTSDLQLRHPFHECEIQFTLKTQRS